MNLAIRGIDADLGDRSDDSSHRDLRADSSSPTHVQQGRLVLLGARRRPALGIRHTAARGCQLCLGAALHAPPLTDRYGGVRARQLSLSSKQSAEGKIRQRLVDADLVDCIVELRRRSSSTQASRFEAAHIRLLSHDGPDDDNNGAGPVLAGP